MKVTKRVYIVRHGESEANVQRIHGTASVPLTEKGVAQAKYIAERCATLPIQKVFASTMTRAQQTSSYIAERMSLPVGTSDLFVEVLGPKKFMGKPYADPEASESFKIIDANFGSGYRFADEENFDDLKERARKALDFLTDLPEQHIALVSHGLFIKFLMAYVVFGQDLSAHEAKQMLEKFDIENTGLTILDYVSQDYSGAPIDPIWKIWVLNDHAHLAD